MTGKKRASFVQALSGKNVIYKDDVPIDDLPKELRDKCLSAMRSRRARLRRKKEKHDQLKNNNSQRYVLLLLKRVMIFHHHLREMGCIFY